PHRTQLLLVNLGNRHRATLPAGTATSQVQCCGSPQRDGALRAALPACLALTTRFGKIGAARRCPLKEGTMTQGARHVSRWLLAMVGLWVGCAQPPSQVSSRTDELMGRATYGGDCSSGLRTFLETILRYGRTTAASRAFAQCMDRAVRTGAGGYLGPYRRC